MIQLNLPPLGKRRESILCWPLLAALPRFAAEFNLRPVGLSREAMGRLIAYDWPRNVRKLRNVIERSAAAGVSLRMADFPEEIRDSHPTVCCAAVLGNPTGAIRSPYLSNFREVRRQFERAYLERYLVEADGKAGARGQTHRHPSSKFAKKA